jgi:TetR/AcrR family transcriptional regulator, lmrAB and yxaGH operons repressor
MAKSTISEEELLDRLTRVFQDYGYEGASLSRISSATGLERSSLYHRFPGGKDEMAEAVLARVTARFLNELLAPLRDRAPLESKIKETGRRLAAFYDNGRVSCVLDTLSMQGGSRALQHAVDAAYSGWRDAFARVALEAGLSPSRARIRAEEAIMSIHGALVLARATRDGKPFARVISRLPELLTASK